MCKISHWNSSRCRETCKVWRATLPDTVGQYVSSPYTVMHSSPLFPIAVAKAITSIIIIIIIIFVYLWCDRMHAITKWRITERQKSKVKCHQNQITSIVCRPTFYHPSLFCRCAGKKILALRICCFTLCKHNGINLTWKDGETHSTNYQQTDWISDDLSDKVKYLIHKNAETSVSTAELVNADQLHESSDNVLYILDLQEHTSNVNKLQLHKFPSVKQWNHSQIQVKHASAVPRVSRSGQLK